MDIINSYSVILKNQILSFEECYSVLEELNTFYTKQGLFWSYYLAILDKVKDTKTILELEQIITKYYITKVHKKLVDRFHTRLSNEAMQATSNQIAHKMYQLYVKAKIDLTLFEGATFKIKEVEGDKFTYEWNSRRKAMVVFQAFINRYAKEKGYKDSYEMLANM